MNTIKYSLMILLVTLSWVACDVDYEENPNETTTPPTTALFNNSTVLLMDRMNDEWWEGRFTLVMMQYWAQNNYTDEDRYQFRSNVAERWETFYGAMEDYRISIAMNTDEETKGAADLLGPNEGQIAMCRIMLSYMFDIMASTYGDIPYWSYGSQDNPDFQALQLTKDILTPKYATQRDIFVDILKELSEAQDQLEALSGKKVSGDPVYDGDLDKWRKFANSLRLRIAMKLKGTSEDVLAKAAFDDAIADGVFTSNKDNANVKFEDNSTNGAPFYQAYYVSNREDFAVAYPFMTLLKGEDLNTTTPKVNPFKGKIDPRLPIFVAPSHKAIVDTARAFPSLTPEMDKYIGMPYGVQDAEAKAFKWYSFPGEEILKANFAIPMMDYSEVLFLLSEYKGWSEQEYRAGVKASMQKWGVAEDDIDAYMLGLPAATKETVLTQKYIALYMQSHQAWTEYRRTGYPKFLVFPGESYTESVIPKPGELVQTYEYTFTPAVDGITDLPARINYSGEEQNLNKTNYEEAVGRLQGGDEITSKLWWMK